MKFSYNWLKELVPFKENPEKLAGFLTTRVFEVESTEKVGSDFALDLKLPSNRISDASGHIGLAKEIASLKRLRIKTQSSAPKIKEDKKYKTGDYLSVRIENPDACLRYSARIMGEIAVKPSPQWLQDRLQTCGIQSINNVVDAANYIMLETGQPTHVFDFETLRAKSKTKKTIIVRNAKKDETLSALDEKNYSLTPRTLVVADEAGAIAIAGIKGGRESGVSEHTATIVLESAHFHPAAIRAASQELRIRTDASVRFENGTDPHQTFTALNRLAELIQEVAGGIILHDAVDVSIRREKAKEILFRTEYANRLIGAAIEHKHYHDIFRAIGCTVRTKRKDEFIVEPPTIRRDLEIEEDLIEEAARMIGFDAIPATLPEVIALSPEKNEELFWEKKIAQCAVSAGFQEALIYEFTGEKELAYFMLDSSRSYELENPANVDMQFLLSRALIKYIGNTAENLRNFDSVRMFGIAKSFVASDDARASHTEKKELIFSYAKKGTDEKENFYMLKGVIDGMLESLGISDHWYDDAIPQEARKKLPLFHPYRVAEVKIGNTVVGSIGEVHPEVLNRLKTKTRIVAAEFDFAALYHCARSEHEFIPPSKFPAIVRDIALIVPEATKVETILNIIENEGGQLLEDTDLFDYFQDEAMQERGGKSLAFHLIFQSSERTLTDEEIEKIMKKIVASLEEKGWEIRR